MKVKALVTLGITLVVAVAATSISISDPRIAADETENAAVCEHGGLQLTAMMNFAAAQESADSAWCGDAFGESSSDVEIIRIPEINLHQTAGDMYVSGEGFNTAGNLNVDVHFIAGGVLGPGYPLTIAAVDAHSFRSQSTGVLCEGSNDRLYVLVIDGHGNEHARIFEPGEFRCPGL